MKSLMAPAGSLLMLLALTTLTASLAGAQTVSVRGFGEASAILFPQETPSDPTNLIGNAIARGEVFYKPTPWIQFAGGLDFRANSDDQVDDDWSLDYADRGARRPRLSVRRLAATFTRGMLTVDAGKQFVRWGKTDVVTPTDRFAPRDFLNVIDAEYLAITAIRAVVQLRQDAFEAVWSPRFTPSRTPLLDQRWSGVPVETAPVPLVDAGAVIPAGSQAGVRWSHMGDRAEYSLSYFDGFNHLPLVESEVTPVPPAVVIRRVYPAVRAFGGDFAMPTPWVTLKAEAAYFRSSSNAPPETRGDDYLLFVAQIERQMGEWMFVGGYAGEIVTESRSSVSFAPDRGLSHAFVGRAGYTIGPDRSVAFEGAARENGRGVYARGEYSQAHGQHWRSTVAGALIAGEEDDFLGQYRRNSYASLTLRYSF